MFEKTLRIVQNDLAIEATIEGENPSIASVSVKTHDGKEVNLTEILETSDDVSQDIQDICDLLMEARDFIEQEVNTR